MYDFKRSVKILLLKKGKSQAWLARELGISRQLLSSWLTRRKNMYFTTIEKLAEALGFEDVSDFISEVKKLSRL